VSATEIGNSFQLENEVATWFAKDNANVQSVVISLGLFQYCTEIVLLLPRKRLWLMFSLPMETNWQRFVLNGTKTDSNREVFAGQSSTGRKPFTSLLSSAAVS